MNTPTAYCVESSRRRPSSRICTPWCALAAVASSLGSAACAVAPEADGTAAAPSVERVATQTSQRDQRQGQGQTYGFGRAATAADISAFDVDIGPDGAGLPAGQGSVQEGQEIYAIKCVACHGATGTEGPFDLLAGRLPNDEFPFATDPSVRSTVGNYWPYATTLFDYTRRTMPFDFPGSLTDNEVYALVGVMLYMNDLVAADAVMDSAAVTNLRMPARDRFVPDDRTGGPVVR